MTRNCQPGEILSPSSKGADLSASKSGASGRPHITVCICTYKRPEFLKRLLNELKTQDTAELFTYSIMVVDNDCLESAKPEVMAFQTAPSVPIRYDVEPKQNIALARNRAVAGASGDYVVFIDDDEFPVRNWLLTLFRACCDYAVDGVLGPVKRHFDIQPPQWVLKGDFYDRATYPTGLVIDWRKGRTGNTLLKTDVLRGENQPFRPEFRQGEDQDFFQRMIDKGYRFIWCDEAVAYEVVPPIRWKRSFMLRRALLRGAMEPKTAGFGPRAIFKSLVAVPLYTAFLPVAAVIGHHRFMAVLIRLFDHLGKLLAVAGFNPVKEQYVTE